MNPHWILVDGYSVLHAWTDLARLARLHLGVAPGRRLAQQRDALVALLQRYADHRGGRVTVVFDGYAARHHPETAAAPGSLEIIFSEAGKTADDVIERWVGEASHRDRIGVVTADNAERHTVESLGAQSISVEFFAAEVATALQDLAAVVRHHSRPPRPGGTAPHRPGERREC